VKSFFKKDMKESPVYVRLKLHQMLFQLVQAFQVKMLVEIPSGLMFLLAARLIVELML
jgi:hypothetical protein